MIAILNQPCGHPLITVPDHAADRARAALAVLHEHALQPQTVAVAVPDQTLYRHQACQDCKKATDAFRDASARRHLLLECEARGVSGFSALELYAALRAADPVTGRRGLRAHRALTAALAVIHAGWRPPTRQTPALEELDPRRAGR